MIALISSKAAISCWKFLKNFLSVQITLQYISFLSFDYTLWMCNLFFFICFNWKIIALQYCVGFCRISMWISHRYTFVPSLLNRPPTPLGCHRAPVWAHCITWQIPTGYLFYTWRCMCFHATLSTNPTLSFPNGVHKSVLCLPPHCCPANRFISTIWRFHI